MSTNKFGSSNANVITLQGFRAETEIEKAGGAMMGTLRAKVYGVHQDDMNNITTLQWKPGTLIFNTVEVYAIDGDQQTLVFAGNIVNAFGDYKSMPNVNLYIQAQSAFFNQLLLKEPRSFKGQIDVATVISQIAKDMGYNFENNGVNVQLDNVYLPNSNMEQIKDLVKMANCDLYLDDNVLAITPKFAPRSDIKIPLIAYYSGLIGYPSFDGIGVTFDVKFNPAIRFGALVDLQTDVFKASGKWVVTSVNHKLDAEKPNGLWQSTVRGNYNGLAITK
jgi:hypothetical protein